MKVYGFIVTDIQIELTRAEFIRNKNRFTSDDVRSFMEKIGVNGGEISMRASDRLLQKWKKSNLICFSVDLRLWLVL